MDRSNELYEKSLELQCKIYIIAKNLALEPGQGFLHIAWTKNKGNPALFVCCDILIGDVRVDGVGGAQAIVGNDEVPSVKGSGSG